MKLQKEVGKLLEILNHMNSGLANCEDDNGEFDNTKFKIGFGDTEVELYCCANFYNGFEAFIKNLVCDVIEEEGLDGEPYDALYAQYDKYNKW